MSENKDLASGASSLHQSAEMARLDLIQKPSSRQPASSNFLDPSSAFLRNAVMQRNNSEKLDVQELKMRRTVERQESGQQTQRGHLLLHIPNRIEDGLINGPSENLKQFVIDQEVFTEQQFLQGAFEEQDSNDPKVITNKFQFCLYRVSLIVKHPVLIFDGLLGLVTLYNFLLFPVYIAFASSFSRVGVLIFFEILNFFVLLFDLIKRILYHKALQEQRRNMASGDIDQKLLSRRNSNVMNLFKIFDKPQDVSKRPATVEETFSMMNDTINKSLMFEFGDYQLDRQILYSKLQIATNFCAFLPLTWMTKLSPKYAGSSIWISVLLLFLRISHFIPFLHLLQKLKRTSMKFSRILHMLLIYFLTVHIFACIWILVAQRVAYLGGRTEPNYSITWINSTLYVSEEKQLKSNCTAHPSNLTNGDIYINSLYFSVSTFTHICLGDMRSSNYLERNVNMVFIVVSVVIYAFLFGNIVSMVTEFVSVAFQKLNENQQAVLAKINREKMPKVVLENIDEYFHLQWKQKKGTSKDFIHELPKTLSTDVLLERFKEGFLQNPLFFQDGVLNTPLVRSILRFTEVRIYLKNEIFVKGGQYDKNLYILLEGELLCYGMDNQYVGFMKQGSHLCNRVKDALDFDNKMLFHIAVSKPSRIAVVKSNDLEKLITAFPEWGAMLLKLNVRFLKIFKESLVSYVKAYKKQVHPELEPVSKVEESKGGSLTQSRRQSILQIMQGFQHDEEEFLDLKDMTQKEVVEALQYHITFCTEDIYEGIIRDHSSLADALFLPKFDLLSIVTQKHSSRSTLNQVWASRFIRRSTHFSPSSRFMSVLEAANDFNVLLVAFVLPVQVCFFWPMERGMLLLEILSQTTSTAYFLCKLRQVVMVDNKPTVAFKHIMHNYWHNNHFLINFIGSLPLNLVCAFLFPSSGSHQGLLAVCLRLTKLVLVAKLGGCFERLEFLLRRRIYIVQISKPIVFFSLSWVWLSALLYCCTVVLQDEDQCSWLEKRHRGDLFRSILLTFYFMIDLISTVAYGDLVPYSNFEKVLMILLFTLSFVTIPVTFGLLAGFFVTWKRESEAESLFNKMNSVIEMLNSYNIDEGLRKNLRDFYTYQWSLSSQSGSKILAELQNYLPYKLAQDILYYQTRDLILPLFTSFESENFMREICLCLQHKIYLPNSFIIMKDEVGEEMYFIDEGKVSVLSGDNQNVVDVLERGRYFGEIAIFLECKRTAYIRAETYCSIYVLMKKDIDRIVKSYPTVQQRFKQQDMRRFSSY